MWFHSVGSQEKKYNKNNITMKLKTTSLLAMGMLSHTTIATAQQKEEVLPYRLSFVAVGGNSDAKWSGEGVNQKVEAWDPGASPPRKLVLKGESDDTGQNEDGEEVPIPLMLNISGQRRELMTQTCRLSKKTINNGEFKYERYLSFKLPESRGNYTVLLARKVKAKDWKSPQYLVLSDAATTFPKGSIRVVNISNQTVMGYINGKARIKLEPARWQVIPNLLNTGDPIKIKMFYMEGKKRKYLMNTTIRKTPSTRLNIVTGFMPIKKNSVEAYQFITKWIPVPVTPPVGG